MENSKGGLSWDQFTAEEQEALSDCAYNAATRALIGFGGVLSGMALVAHLRRNSPPLPRGLRIMSVAVFSVSGLYIGAVSSVPACARRIIEIPDSELAANVRVAVENWNMDSAPKNSPVIYEDRRRDV